MVFSRTKSGARASTPLDGRTRHPDPDSETRGWGDDATDKTPDETPDKMDADEP